jgi:hypothetical protein
MNTSLLVGDSSWWHFCSYAHIGYKHHIQNLGEGAQDFAVLQLRRLQGKRYRIWNFVKDILRELPQVIVSFGDMTVATNCKF